MSFKFEDEIKLDYTYLFKYQPMAIKSLKKISILCFLTDLFDLVILRHPQMTSYYSVMIDNSRALRDQRIALFSTEKPVFRFLTEVKNQFLVFPSLFSTFSVYFSDIDH